MMPKARTPMEPARLSVFNDTPSTRASTRSVLFPSSILTIAPSTGEPVKLVQPETGAFVPVHAMI